MKKVVIIFAIIIAVGLLLTKPKGGSYEGEYGLNGAPLESVVAENAVVLVDFGAPWCGPCRIMDPVMADIAEAGTAKVIKINVDKEQALARQYNISTIPAFVIFKDGKVVARERGVIPANYLTRHF